MPQTRPTLSRRSLLAGAAAVAAVPSLATAQTPVASPAAAGDFIEHINPLLAIAPAELIGTPEETLVPFEYVDLASQLASLY